MLNFFFFISKANICKYLRVARISVEKNYTNNLTALLKMAFFQGPERLRILSPEKPDFLGICSCNKLYKLKTNIASSSV